jgi:hypothetical protein
VDEGQVAGPIDVAREKVPSRLLIDGSTNVKIPSYAA